MPKIEKLYIYFKKIIQDTNKHCFERDEYT